MAHATQRDRRRIGLRALIGLAVLGPLALVAVGVFWLGGRVVERAVTERMEEDVALVARAIQMPLSRALAEGAESQLYESLESAFLIRRLYGATVYDASGTVVAEVGEGVREDELPEVGRMVEAGRGGEYGLAGGRRVYSYFVPLTSPGGRIEGLLQVTRRRSDIEATVRAVRLRAAAVFGAVLALTAVLVLTTYHRSIGRHFHRLSAAMAGVERGARDATVPAAGPREVADMAESFNRMVAGVERAEAEVAERREREVELEAQLRRTEKLAAIGRLAGGVAHELGTPLAVVDGVAQRLERGSPVDREAVARIRGAVGRMEWTVRQLLEFGSRVAGERGRAAAGPLLVSAAGAVRGEASTRGVALEVAASASEEWLVGDGRRIEAALVHLLRNGIQAAGEGPDGGRGAGAGGRVRAEVVATPGAVLFVVEDSGPGVAAEARDRLFEPFFTTKRVGEGAGLGLSVVHAVAEEHGGRVEVADSPLGGARFTLVVGRGEVDHG